ncbi:protein IQ-DOMAIN 14-like [Hyaena hyaena]|uniref:protein IQ-DOMAIN 14-like n=1 Tax=Hyaena hyaena TaxID=95912 RepID=UPI0019212E1D|nr:protein IQ-DOMAIN 14-like [Hyaena hyaena]
MGSPPAPLQVSGAAAQTVPSRICHHSRHRQDRPPPSVTSRTRRPGCLAARTRAPSTPRPLPSPHSRGPRRARALAPAPPPGLLTRRPPALRAFALQSPPTRPGSRSHAMARAGLAGPVSPLSIPTPHGFLRHVPS